MRNQAFTLIEILVVVLIIGILAAIALPNFQKAVIKSKYSKLKSNARTLATAMEIYYLANNSYPTKYEDLDIDFHVVGFANYENHSFYIYLDDGSNCEMYYDSDATYCSDTIYGRYMRYGQAYFSDVKYCIVYSADKNDKWNSICQQETGTLEPAWGSSSSFYTYIYN